MILSIIIPVFNEEKTIEKVLQKLTELNLGLVKKEIIVIDDGSTDKTSQIVKYYSQKNNRNIVTFFHGKNKGKGAAVRTGIAYAKGEYILIQDADLEYNPEDIKKLLFCLEKNPKKAIFGTRLARMPHFNKEERRPQFLLHFIGNRFLSLLTSLLYGQWLTDMETCYKLFPRSAVARMQLKSKGFELEPELTAKLLKQGIKIIEFPITANPRGYEEGKKLRTVQDGIKALYTLIKYRFTN